MQQPIEAREIWKDLLQDKDDLSILDLSQKYDVAPSEIAAAFRRLGIQRKPTSARNVRPSKASREALRSRPKPSSQPMRTLPDGRPEPRPNSKDPQILRFWDQLGQVPDTHIARQARVSPQSVKKFRDLHGIPEYRRSAGAKRQRPSEAKAGRKSSGPRETPSVRRAREIEAILGPFEHLLGKLPDSNVAKLANLTLQTVRHQRQKRGIPAAGKLPRKEIAKLLEQYGFKPEDAGLKLPAEPAKSRERPRAARAQAAPAPTPAAPATTAAQPAPAPAASGRLREVHAWRVVFVQKGTEDSRIVVADSFVAAAAKAQEWIGADGAISLVESMGPALA